jgi:hypothetical protein
MRAGNLGVPTTSEWLNDVLAPGGRVGIDPVSNTLLLKMPALIFLFLFSCTVQSVLSFFQSLNSRVLFILKFRFLLYIPFVNMEHILNISVLS